MAFRMSAGGGPRQAGVARWHGANWAIVRTFPGEVPLPCDGDFAIDEHDDVFVYLASSADSSKLGQARVAVRQESAWWDLGQPFPSLSGQRVDPCPRLAVSRAGTPWAAVSTSSNGTDGFITYVSRWTGASWQTNPFPFVAKASGDGSARQGIWLAGLIVDGSGAPVVALEQRELDTLTTKVERWTGAQWQELGRLTKDSYPLAVSRSGAPVIVTSVSTGLQVLEWDGSTWQPIGGPIPLSRHVLAPAIAFDEADRPIVAFVQAPPEEGSYVCLHRWSGSAWERIPAPLNPTPSNPISEPFSLAVSQNGTIFLAFTQPDFTVEQYGPEP